MLDGLPIKLCFTSTQIATAMSVVTVTPADVEHMIMRAHLHGIFHRDATTYTDAALNTAVVDAIAQHVNVVSTLRRRVKMVAPPAVAKTAAVDHLRIYAKPKNLSKKGDFSAALQRTAAASLKTAGGYGPRAVACFAKSCTAALSNLDDFLLLSSGSCVRPGGDGEDGKGDPEVDFLNRIAEEVDNLSCIAEEDEGVASPAPPTTTHHTEEGEGKEEPDSATPPPAAAAVPRSTRFLEPHLLSLGDLHEQDATP